MTFDGEVEEKNVLFLLLLPLLLLVLLILLDFK